MLLNSTVGLLLEFFKVADVLVSGHGSSEEPTKEIQWGGRYRIPYLHANGDTPVQSWTALLRTNRVAGRTSSQSADADGPGCRASC